jgi:hypothetical protein
MLQRSDIGKSVVGPSFTRLGVLARVYDNCFSVRTDAGEVWVLNEAVWSVDDQVTLICEPVAIERYLCDEPEEPVGAR